MSPHLRALLLVNGCGLRVQHHCLHRGDLGVLMPEGLHHCAVLRQHCGCQVCLRRQTPWMACRALSKLRLRLLCTWPLGCIGLSWRRGRSVLPVRQTFRLAQPRFFWLSMGNSSSSYMSNIASLPALSSAPETVEERLQQRAESPDCALCTRAGIAISPAPASGAALRACLH